MRTISSFISFIFVMTAVVANVDAKPPTIVYPTGIFPTDVQNVQAAINQGGMVLLKATDSVGHPLAFNFGTPQHLPPLRAVIIQNDVSITGEVVGASQATVSGGSTPFRVFGGRNSIQGIKFDGPLARAILVEASNGTSITNNEIENIVPDPLSAGFTQADGIDVLGFSNTDITGNVLIAGNVIQDLTGDFSIGIQLDTIGANVEISSNFLKIGQTVADNIGDVESAGIATARCHKPVLISGNAITIGPGLVFAGIVITGDSDALYRVIGNFIDSQSSGSDGINASQDLFVTTGGSNDSAVISYNWINLHQSQYNGIDIFGAFTRGTIKSNIIVGNAGTAFACYAFDPDPADTTDQAAGNHFLFNDISHLSASFASIYFDVNTLNNLVVGECGSTDVDLGVGNQFRCSDRQH